MVHTSFGGYIISTVPTNMLMELSPVIVDVVTELFNK